MARVKMPDGQVVEMPDTLTPELAARLKSLQSASAAKPEPTPKAEIRPPKTQLGGAGGMMLPIAEAAGNALSSGIGSVAGSVAGLGALGKELIAPSGGRTGDIPAETQSRVQKALTYEPRTRVGQDLTKYNPVTLASKGLSKLGDYAGDIVAGGKPSDVGADTLRGMAGNATRAAVPLAAGYGLSKLPGAVKSMAPTIEPETLELARKAHAAGIPLRPDMLTNSKVARLVGDTLEQVPFSGNKGENRVAQFTAAVGDLIGADPKSTKLTPSVFHKAITASGEGIGGLSEKYPIPSSPKFDAALQGLMDATEYETTDVGRIMKKYIGEIHSKIGADGVIDGTTFRKIRTQLTSQMRKAQAPDLKDALSRVDDVMLDQIEEQLSPEEMADFNKFRKQYAYAKVIEPIVAKGDGVISPRALMSRVTASSLGKSTMAKGTTGDIGDLARIGQKFVNEPTPPRQQVYGALGELGAGAVAPMTTGGVIGGANLYNRLAPYAAERMITPPKP